MVFRKVFALAFGCSLLLPGSEAGAIIETPTIAELAKTSDVIVLARVESVTGHPSDLDRRAKATVTEVWKGPKTASVEFLASPTWVCDISDAKPDETVLLFLVKGKEAGWVINWAGRGRRPLRSLDGKTYVSCAGVILPPGTPSITGPVGSEGGFDRAVELDTVQNLVMRAIRDKK